ncbi:ABC transporter permease [Roseomonas sp. CCTCC AB2023176]|uniref:ABC transporter permease n=1 Tax=Roseomonas sp. CCTCC AB2023176 TaxID=3342640 RepID=UPI0035DBF7A8
MLSRVLREAVVGLLASRQRAALALLGIVVGAGAVIAMLNVGAMARNETIQQFRAMGTDILAIRYEGAFGGFTLPDIQSLPQTVPGVTEVAPLILGGGPVAFEGQTRSATTVATTDGFLRVARLSTASGRFVSSFDQYELYGVLGARLANDLSTPYSRVGVGSEIRAGRYVLRVVGILAPSLPSPMMPVDADGSLFVSIPNARRLMPEPTISTVLLRLTPEADPEVASAGIRTVLEPRLRDATLGVQSARQLLAGMASQMQLFTLLLGAVGSIALILGGVGVMNIMIISIAERRREIGIRLAIGARRSEIRALFLSEAVVLALVGGILGIAVGIAGAWGFARLSGWTFVLSPVAAPLGAGVSAAVGVFFGFYPAVMASRLDPIEALRSE